MTLEAWEWGDPARIIERKQQRAANQERVCKGCVHKRAIESKGEMTHACALKRGNPTIYCNFKQIKDGDL